MKTFVIDTSVLIHDPNSLSSFAEHHVRIPVEVIHEIDRLKTEPGERGRSARAVQRNLLELFKEKELTHPTPTPGGGTIAVLLPKPTAPTESPNPKGIENPLRALGKMDTNDHHIIAAAFNLLRGRKPNPNIVLITKDIGMILKARSIGLNAQDYLHDKIEVLPKFPEEGLPVKPKDVQEIHSKGKIFLPDLASKLNLQINQYVLLGEKKLPARHKGNGEFTRLKFTHGIQIQGGIHIRPLNVGQQFLLDALLDPTIKLVTVRGSAGTGKTLLSIAAAIHSYQNQTYNKILIAKPIISSGGNPGALPGTLEEKMKPWLQGYSDALDILFPNERQPQNLGNGPQNKATSQHKKSHQQAPPPSVEIPRKPKNPYDCLLEDGTLQIEALTYIRGRSIPKAFFLFDECQNTTPGQAKTIVTRIGKESKIILLGDEEQIDNPYVDKLSNGLSYIRTRMDNLAQCAHIYLNKGERSEIAEIAAKRL